MWAPGGPWHSLMPEVLHAGPVNTKSCHKAKELDEREMGPWVEVRKGGKEKQKEGKKTQKNGRQKGRNKWQKIIEPWKHAKCKSQAQKTLHYMKCPDQANLDIRSVAVWEQRLERGFRDWEVVVKHYRISFGVIKMLWNGLWWWLCKSVNILKTSELYTWNGWIT